MIKSFSTIKRANEGDTLRILNLKGEEIPVILDNDIVNDYILQNKFIWITGLTKPQLEVRGIEVIQIAYISYSLYGYLVSRKEFNDYLLKNNLPMLIYRIGVE